MKDSQGKTYSADVLDMLVKTYNFMVNNKFEFTPLRVLIADKQTSGFDSTQKYADKFIEELDYIKELSKNQPTTEIKIQWYGWVNNEWGLTNNVEVLTNKTYDARKMNSFVQDTKYKQRFLPNEVEDNNRYKVINIAEINEDKFGNPRK